MNTLLLGLLAETFIHTGGGQSEGVVDLPVARQAATDFPFIPGSAMKGAWRDLAKQRLEETDCDSWFGKQDNAGQILFTDARLLALPVRSLQGASRWVTCPQLLERYSRDTHRARLGETALGLPDIEPGSVLGAGEGNLTLEERRFTLAGIVPESIVQSLCQLLPHEDTQKRFKQALVILHDDDFSWFARFGLAVQARNVLDDKTKESKNLWYEESLPPDTLLYTLISARSGNMPDDFISALRSHPYLQAGGNETVGQGWLALSFLENQS